MNAGAEINTLFGKRDIFFVYISILPNISQERLYFEK